MKREELVTQIAKAVAAARDDEVTVELVSDIRWASYLGFANAIVTHLDSLGMVVVRKEDSLVHCDYMLSPSGGGG